MCPEKTKKIRRKMIVLTGILFCAVFAAAAPETSAGRKTDDLQIAANFAEKEILPDEKLQLGLSRTLLAEEGRLAVFLNELDLTSLFIVEPQVLTYLPKFAPLPAGENSLTIYLVQPDEEWKKLAEFTLKVKTGGAAEAVPAAPENFTGSGAASAAAEGSEKWKMEFTPNVSLNVKGQNQTLTYPREAAPERNPFTDLAGQGEISFKIERGGWALSNQFNFAGTTYQQEALRFGELGARAPRIDLSSYLVQFGKGRFAVRLGHVSFGSNRHLINSFSSRGITVTVPIGKQNEISFAAANGTSIVGYDNFTGVTRSKHQVLSATFAREFFKERPGGLRLEFSVLRGSLLPLGNFNQGEINDAERSVGFGLKVFGSDRRQRLRYEASYTRSRFTNPADPLLAQGFSLTQVRPSTREAHYGELSFDFLQGLKLWKEKKLKLTGTVRHEEIEPLFRSVAAFAQADRRQNQFEVTASFGEINFVYGNLRDRDNLDDLASILKTLNRRGNFVVSIGLNSFFTPSKPKKWLPQLSYMYEQTHQFGAFLPASGLFDNLSQVPDQQSVNRSFNAQWQFSDKFGFGFRSNRTFQDNRQPGRDRADFSSGVDALTFTVKPHGALDLDLDLSREELKNLEQTRTDRTFRFGARTVWRTPFLKNSTFSAGLSSVLAGDTNDFNDTRNIEFDVQWAYRFEFGKEKFKKLQAQFFVRYANRYGDARDRLFFIDSFNKTQVFNAGLNFNLF